MDHQIHSAIASRMKDLLTKQRRGFLRLVSHPALRLATAILALTVARLCVRLVTKAPKPGPATRPLLLGATAAHAALYVALVAMVASGWLMATTTPVRVRIHSSLVSTIFSRSWLVRMRSG